MGSCHSYLTPFPPNYIALTFLPNNELWICQGPPFLIDFIRQLIGQIWPRVDYRERHCDVPNRHRQTKDGQLHSAIQNTVFRIPSDPFTISPIHQSVEIAESAYRFVMILVAYLYSTGYEMISAGHFIRGTEASTCLFRCRMDDLRRNNSQRIIDVSQTRRFTPLRLLPNKGMKMTELNSTKRMLVVGLEGWNRLYCLNITQKLVKELVNELRTVRNCFLDFDCQCH